jgi:hypothetical protein
MSACWHGVDVINFFQWIVAELRTSGERKAVDLADSFGSLALFWLF